MSSLRITISMWNVLCCLLLGLSLVMTGCGGPPTIRASSVITPRIEKVAFLHFIYRDVEMREVSSYTYGQGGARIVDTGFDGFGRHLVEQAEIAFTVHQVSVRTATVIDGETPLSSAIPSSDDAEVPILVIAPVSGKTQANRHSTVTSYVFSAYLLDADGRQPVWKSIIDTSTWAGNDFVMKKVRATMYDEAYAAQLLKALVERMKRDGVI